MSPLLKTFEYGFIEFEVEGAFVEEMTDTRCISHPPAFESFLTISRLGDAVRSAVPRSVQIYLHAAYVMTIVRMRMRPQK